MGVPTTDPAVAVERLADERGVHRGVLRDHALDPRALVKVDRVRASVHFPFGPRGSIVLGRQRRVV